VRRRSRAGAGRAARDPETAQYDAADEDLDRIVPPAPVATTEGPVTQSASGDDPAAPAPDRRLRAPTTWLRVVVFVVGAASLGTEIAAARLLAPYFGASTIVWANTIGTVLLALSVGYWLGGRLADRDPSLRGLCRLVLVAGLLLAAIPYAARPFLDTAVSALDSISAGAAIGSLVAVLVLVAGPVLLLGAVSPYAVRLALRRVEESGSVTGGLYALSTAGSLFGTFTAALVLIPFVGTHRTFLIFALALTLVAAPALRRVSLLAGLVVLVLLALPPGAIRANTADEKVIYETETPYQYARVVEDRSGTRSLELNEGLAVHSIYRPGRYLTNGYWDDFLVAPLAVSGQPPQRLAILGNAGGTTARAYGHFLPATRIDAVELDGRLTRIARRYFDLRAPHLRLITADARPFLRSTHRRYDAIFIDAYRQPYVPFYLATREFFALVRSRLDEHGALVVNVGHPDGSTTLERALGRTIRAEFPAVWRDPVSATNTLVIAGRSASPVRLASGANRLPVSLRPLGASVARRLARALSGGTVLTDDRAPVEWLIDRSIIQYASGAR
jgi:spermidine synthase